MVNMDSMATPSMNSGPSLQGQGQGAQGQGTEQEIALRTLLVAVTAAQSKSPYSMEEASAIWKAMSVFVKPVAGAGGAGPGASQIVQSAQTLP